jgi:hypothetical protein
MAALTARIKTGSCGIKFNHEGVPLIQEQTAPHRQPNSSVRWWKVRHIFLLGSGETASSNRDRHTHQAHSIRITHPRGYSPESGEPSLPLDAALTPTGAESNAVLLISAAGVTAACLVCMPVQQGQAVG